MTTGISSSENGRDDKLIQSIMNSASISFIFGGVTGYFLVYLTYHFWAYPSRDFLVLSKWIAEPEIAQFVHLCGCLGAVVSASGLAVVNAVANSTDRIVRAIRSKQ